MKYAFLKTCLDSKLIGRRKLISVRKAAALLRMIGCGNRDCIHYRLLLMIFMLIALWGIIAENGWSGNIMRGEVFWGIVEKYWVLNAWCDILKKMLMFTAEI